MRVAIFIALKDLRLLLRDRMALFWAFVFPVVFALFIGSVLSSSVSGTATRLPVAFVDDSRGEASRKLRLELEASEGILLRAAAAAAEAEQSVRSGDDLAYVRVPADFAAGAEVELGVDPSRPGETALVRAALTQALMRARAPAATPLSSEPVRLIAVLRTARPPNPFSLVFPSAIAWGLMGCAATFAVAMVAERSGGTLLRLRAAPLPKSSLVLGKALACAIACLSTVSVLLGIAWLGFGVRIGSLPLMALALASITLCFVGLTQVLSLLGKTEQAVSGAGWATLLFMAMLGGAMVPVSLMPAWMQRLSDLSPIRWGIFALEGAMWRGLGLRELVVPCAVLAGVGLVGFVLGTRLSARREA